MPPINAPLPNSNRNKGAGNLVFPNDLLDLVSTYSAVGGTQAPTASTASGGNNPPTKSTGGYYSQFQFVAANNVIGAGYPIGVSGSFPVFNTISNVYLPLPLKINDVELALWQDATVLDYIPIISAGIAYGSSKTPAGTQAGNPFLYTLYKQPLFREFVFQWILAPNSPDESTVLLEILYAFKTAILPDIAVGGIFLSYPYLVYVRLNPNEFLFDILPCCIISCEIDFSGSGHTPSFFNSGAPTIISFTVHLKEVQILTRQLVAPRGGSISTGMIGGGGG